VPYGFVVSVLVNGGEPNRLKQQVNNYASSSFNMANMHGPVLCANADEDTGETISLTVAEFERVIRQSQKPRITYSPMAAAALGEAGMRKDAEERGGVFGGVTLSKSAAAAQPKPAIINDGSELARNANGTTITCCDCMNAAAILPDVDGDYFCQECHPNTS
jgi:hypothetical protein